MRNTDNNAVEKALLFDMYYGDDMRAWEDMSGETELREMILHWFCRRVLADGLLFPKVPEDRVDVLCRTYALGSVLAAQTNAAKTTETASQAAVSVLRLFDTATVGGQDFAIRRTDSIRLYQQTFLDSAKGTDDRISAMELAYMYMCDIPRDTAHARELTRICYDWMYWYSKTRIDRIAAEKADIESLPAFMY